MDGELYTERATAIQRLSVSTLHMEDEWNLYGMEL